MEAELGPDSTFAAAVDRAYGLAEPEHLHVGRPPTAAERLADEDGDRSLGIGHNHASVREPGTTPKLRQPRRSRQILTDRRSPDVTSR